MGNAPHMNGWEPIANAPMFVYGKDALVGHYVEGFGWKKVSIWEREWTRDQCRERGATHWWPHLRDLPLPSAPVESGKEPRYEVQVILDDYRITDKMTDSRIATCYRRERADFIVRALNALAPSVETKNQATFAETIERAAQRIKLAFATERSIMHGHEEDHLMAAVRALAPSAPGESGKEEVGK